jgi:pimeloyl-ACP methyl ester carboxylesterase
MGRLVDVDDTRLYVDERGNPGGFPLLVLHGGPGLDHHMFGDYLDPLTDDGTYRLVLVDERAQGGSDRSAPPETWTLGRMTADITDLASALGLSDYAVLGHSFGAFLALQHAVSFAGSATATIVSAGVASSRWLERVDGELARFEPVALREQVTSSWARESTVQTEDEAGQLLADQMPFHFREPSGPIYDDYMRRAVGARFAPDVMRHFATQDYGGIDVDDQLSGVTQPVLVLSGRHDRTCCVEAGADMADRLPDARFVVFEDSAHMLFAEQEAHYLSTVRDFLDEVTVS